MMTIPRELWAVIGAILCNVAAQIALKQSGNSSYPWLSIPKPPGWLAELFNPWIWLGLASYGISFWLTIIVYRAFPLSIVTPLMAASSIVLTVLAAMLLFAEPLGHSRLAGIALIIAGIFLITR
ncbi:MAG: hypothetical protein EPN21_18110 [Methylococcaceae bacterium]|nr:MAG: hypothetical protein EPN21_18110 [Methylococcaceae bacterium]